MPKKKKKRKEERQGRTLCLAQDNWKGTYVLQREADKSIWLNTAHPVRILVLNKGV